MVEAVPTLGCIWKYSADDPRFCQGPPLVRIATGLQPGAHVAAAAS